MSDTIDYQIQQAIALGNSGNKAEAKKLLAQVVQKEPSNVRAWYLLSQVVEQSEQSIYCLQQVLKSQPGNAQAIERLEKLRPKTEQVFEELPPPDELEISPPLPQDAPISIKRAPKQKRQLYLILGLAIVFICFVCAITFWLNNEKARNKPAVIPVMPTPTIAIDNYKWIVYEIIYTQKRWGLAAMDLSAGKSISITWINNTGGINQGNYYIGDGESHDQIDITDKTVRVLKPVKPFRAGYEVDFGDYVSISAQSGDSYGSLYCTIYITDAEGANCFINNGINCGKIGKWKYAFCNGKFCICDVSGTFGIP